jgi:hypothetical protein
MILPTIHSNGTSPEMLRDGYSAARLAVADAERALGCVEFNARDYYVQGPDAWRAAVLEMESRFNRLLTIKTELETLEMHCQDMIDAREAQRR